MVAVNQQTFSLSGFGGGYEDMCQRMLWRGVAYLAEAKPDPAMWDGVKEYANIYGVMVTDGAEIKALESAIMTAGDDVTGAMHQCVMGHLRFIHTHSLDEWRTFMAPHRTAPGDSFEWAGDI